MELIDEIKGAMELEVRVSPEADVHFEAVFQSKDMDKLVYLLEKNLGKPLKAIGQKVKFSKQVAKVVDLMGGIRHEQSFYLKEDENGEYMCAALWPWQSDPSKITLKMKKGNFAQI